MASQARYSVGGRWGTYKEVRAVRDPNSLGSAVSWLSYNHLQGRDPPHAARTGLLSLPRAHHTPSQRLANSTRA